MVVAAGNPLAKIEHFQQEMFQKVAPSVVYIATADGFGSGTVVASDGLILTNAHVVKKARTVNVVLHDGRHLEGRVIERARDDVDLALVKVKARHLPAVTVGGPNTLRVGSWVAAVGHGQGGVWSFNVGMVSNIYPEGAEKPVFQTQIPLNPGNSGGPVVDRRGHVVGIVTSGLQDSNSINFAIRSNVAGRFLNKLRITCDCLLIQAPADVPVFVDGAMVGQGPLVMASVDVGSHEVFAVVDGKMRRTQLRYPRQRSVNLRD